MSSATRDAAAPPPEAAQPDEPYAAFDRQRLAQSFAMWIFLATEVLFFGGLFAGYAVYRFAYTAEFTEAARQTEVHLGTLNTLILLTSSLFVALAVETVGQPSQRFCRWMLGIAIALGVAFLAVKGYEYRVDIVKGLVPGAGSELAPGPGRIFIAFYWVMTGLHALHVTIGLGALAVMLRRLIRRPEAMRRKADLQVAGLYWHFVDAVWIFLYPLLYLVGRAQ